MRPLSSVLDRFRRGVAVPAAAGDDLAAELAQVFASLEAFEAEADAVRRASTRQAEDRVAAGIEQVARVSEGWRARAEAERARAAEDRRRRAREEASVLEERGRVEADRMRERASRRTPQLVAEIVACVEREPS
jgi:hypothetical protein